MLRKRGRRNKASGGGVRAFYHPALETLKGVELFDCFDRFLCRTTSPDVCAGGAPLQAVDSIHDRVGRVVAFVHAPLGLVDAAPGAARRDAAHRCRKCQGLGVTDARRVRLLPAVRRDDSAAASRRRSPRRASLMENQGPFAERRWRIVGTRPRRPRAAPLPEGAGSQAPTGSSRSAESSVARWVGSRGQGVTSTSCAPAHLRAPMAWSVSSRGS